MKWLTIVIGFGVLLAGSGCSSSHRQPGGATRTVAVRLSGEVTHESSRGDRPVQGAIVKLTQSNKVVGETITDAQGKFTVASVPTGPFNVVVEAEEYQRYDYEAEEGELIDALNFGTGRKWLNIRLEGPQTVLRGRVIDAESGSGIARVRVSTYPLTVEASTDETGRYVLTSGSFEQEMDYRLEAAHGSYIGFLSKAFRLAPGEELDLLDVPLRLQTPQIDTVRAGEPDYSTKDTGIVVRGTW